MEFGRFPVRTGWLLFEVGSKLVLLPPSIVLAESLLKYTRPSMRWMCVEAVVGFLTAFKSHLVVSSSASTVWRCSLSGYCMSVVVESIVLVRLQIVGFYNYIDVYDRIDGSAVVNVVCVDVEVGVHVNVEVHIGISSDVCYGLPILTILVVHVLTSDIATIVAISMIGV